MVEPIIIFTPSTWLQSRLYVAIIAVEREGESRSLAPKCNHLAIRNLRSPKRSSSSAFRHIPWYQNPTYILAKSSPFAPRPRVFRGMTDQVFSGKVHQPATFFGSPVNVVFWCIYIFTTSGETKGMESHTLECYIAGQNHQVSPCKMHQAVLDHHDSLTK